MIRHPAVRRTGPRGRRVTAAVLGLLGMVGLGLGLGSASGVTLGANTLGAGVTTIAPCQGSAPITVTFTSGFNTTYLRYEATYVQLTGINAACNNRGYQFRVVTTTGALAEEDGTVSGGATASEGITSTPVANIVSIQLVIP